MTRRRKSPSIREIAASGQVLEMEQTSRAAQRLALIVQSHGDAILSVDLRRRVRTWNPAAQRLLGLRERDIVGKPVTLLAPPILRRELLATVQRAAREGHAELEIRRLRKGGATVCVSVGVAPLRDPRGRIIGFSATLRDVSERHRIEDALQRSELKLRAITDSAKDAIILMGDDGKISFWNPAAEKMFGRTRDEAVGRPLHETLGARAHLPAFRKGFAKWRRTGTGPVVGETLELAGRRKDGTEFPIELSVSSLFLDGRWHAVGIARDITARKGEENVLKASEEKYRALVETTDTGFLILDGAGRVVDANPEYLRLTGRRKFSDILGRSVVEWTAAHERQRNAEAVARCIRDRVIHDLIIEYVDDAGRVTPVEINATAVGDGAALRIISLCRDITARLRAEDAVRESEEKFRRLVESLQYDHFFYRHGTDGVFSYVSPSVRMILGYGEKEFLTHYSRYLTDASLNREAGAQTERSIRGETRPPYELEIFHRDGSRHRLRVLETPVFDAAGHVVAVEGMAQDITEQLRAAEALRESETRYRTLFASAAEGIVLMPVDGGPLIANDSFARMHGYRDAKEVASLGLTDLDTPETARLAPGRLRRLRAGEKMSFEVEHYRRDGSRFPLRVSCSLIKVDGKPFYLGFHRDITRLKRTEEDLRRSEERFRRLYETAPIGVGVVRDGIILFANRAYLRMCGYRSGKSVVGMRLDRQVAPQCRREVLRRIRQRVWSPTGQDEYETVLLRQDGSQFPVQVRLGAIRLPDGQAWSVFLTDLSESRRKEKIVQESEARFRTLIDASPIAIAVLHDRSITLVNKAFLSLFGFRFKEEVVGMAPESLTAPEQARELQARHRRRLLGGDVPSSYETVARRKDGMLFPVAVQVGTIILPEGRSFIHYFVDLSARKRGEKQLRDMHARIVTVQETERKRLSRDLHDDVGQILSGAKYSLHSLATKLAAASPPAFRRVLKVADLLDRAAAEVRRVSWDLMPPELEAMGLPSAVRTHCRDFAERRGIRVTVECGLLPRLIAPETSLSLFRIIQEALANIATHAGATRATVRLGRKNGAFELAIVDNGTGFVVERRPRRKRHHGAGLGNIQQRAESCGGTMALFSEPGRGTQLVVRFPLTRV